MESITYLIGNGFDINLGLKTKYTDFYGEYIASVKDLDDNDCRKRFAMKIDGNYENWSDFEAGFADNITGGKDAVIKILSYFKLIIVYHTQSSPCMLIQTALFPMRTEQHS